ncbi:hypothetical protein JCM19231_4043 [Vibrio ishigakensis]|uniref:Uncharacterized protein n=1 Tax=Vibrio ishigakensis TaxID=1481914 RepID=A0A0B8NUX1_9VIBR|nr:hypothetical protein JCM19231_4043 [Vibrio ishigakensis]
MKEYDKTSTYESTAVDDTHVGAVQIMTIMGLPKGSLAGSIPLTTKT